MLELEMDNDLVFLVVLYRLLWATAVQTIKKKEKIKTKWVQFATLQITVENQHVLKRSIN